MIKSLDKKIKNKSHKIFKAIIRTLIAIILIVLQIAMYLFIFFGLNILKGPFPTAYNIIYEIFKWFGVVIVLLLFTSTINQSYKFSWTFFILLCPFIGTVCYIMFGNARALTKNQTKKMKEFQEFYHLQKDTNLNVVTEDVSFNLIVNALKIDSRFSLYQTENLVFFNDAAKKHSDMLEELKKAKKYIFIEYFIIASGLASADLFDILIDKACEGVEVKILTDDIGSIFVRDKHMERLIVTVPNLEFKVWEPLGLTINPRVNYRDHRKICIIDGLIAYTGGDNIADEYVHKLDRFGFWRDVAIKVYGRPVRSFLNMFLSMWYMTTNVKLDMNKYIPMYENTYKTNSYVFPFSDGPMNRDNPSYNLFKNLFNSAKKRIVISTPYFIIDDQMIDTLISKVKQGVEVNILIPGIPDKKIAYTMTMSHMNNLLKAGANVYKFSPGFNHAKEVIIDDTYAFVGTVNTDYRSFILHFEDGVLIKDYDIVKEMNEDFNNMRLKSEKIDYNVYKNRNICIKFIELVLKVVSPLF